MKNVEVLLSFYLLQAGYIFLINILILYIILIKIINKYKIDINIVLQVKKLSLNESEIQKGY